MSSLKAECLSYKQISYISQSFLDKIHPNCPIPVPIEEIIEIDLGIHINLIPGLKKAFGIDGFINSYFSTITVDDYCYNQYKERTRFTLAHELGHKILHENIYKQQPIKDINQYLEFQNKIPKENSDWLEYQANVFAACLLVPTKKLKEEVEKLLNDFLTTNQIDLSIPYLTPLPALFEVSNEVLFRRIQKEKLLKEKM